MRKLYQVLQCRPLLSLKNKQPRELSLLAEVESAAAFQLQSGPL